MRYGIFSDIHANLEALDSMLLFLSEQEIDVYVCAGDIVGYGADPNECVEKVRALAPLKIVAGNHDWAACGLKDVKWFNDYAQKSLAWTRKQLTQENQIYLSELPKTAEFADFTVVHGSPRSPLDEYLVSRTQYEENLRHLKTRVTFVGHSHVPLVFTPAGFHLFRGTEAVFFPKDQGNIVINPGAVGQPRDGNNRAACGVFDTRTREFRLFRFEYNIGKAQEKMHKARLPAFLVERLYWGK